jgi:hypothetical protein
MAQTTLGDLHRATPWLWLYCEKCSHHSPLACAVAVIRWGADTSSDKEKLATGWLALPLSRTVTFPPLRPILSHWALMSIDEQAIALTSTLVAFTSLAQPCAAASLARCGQFFIHSIFLGCVHMFVTALVTDGDELASDWPRGGPVASFTMKLSVCSSIVHGGGKRRGVIAVGNWLLMSVSAKDSRRCPRYAQSAGRRRGK